MSSDAITDTCTCTNTSLLVMMGDVMEYSNTTSNDALYHEKQRLALCAVHSVNNILQQKKYDQKDFDQVCENVSPSSYWLNPHRSMLRIGNFDVNIISSILQQEGMDVIWHDQRNELTATDLISVDTGKSLHGILWNIPSDTILGRLLHNRHWIALLYRPINNDNDIGSWINLDSNLSKPEVVGTCDDCVRLLQSKTDSQILFVYRSL